MSVDPQADVIGPLVVDPIPHLAVAAATTPLEKTIVVSGTMIDAIVIAPEALMTETAR